MRRAFLNCTTRSPPTRRPNKSKRGVSLLCSSSQFTGFGFIRSCQRKHIHAFISAVCLFLPPHSEQPQRSARHAANRRPLLYWSDSAAESQVHVAHSCSESGNDLKPVNFRRDRDQRLSSTEGFLFLSQLTVTQRSKVRCFVSRLGTFQLFKNILRLNASSPGL